MTSSNIIYSPITFESYTIRLLEIDDDTITQAVNLLCANCPNESARYDDERLRGEIECLNTRPFYKLFFGAYDSDNSLVAVGGVKAADWASDTHILYTMAVDKAHRGKGLGSKLEWIRIQWVREHFNHGRFLVSTKHKKRFERWDFHVISEINGRHLMMLTF